MLSRLVLLCALALFAIGCQGRSSPESSPTTWEDLGVCMATEQTENAANADFADGLTVPETGDSFNSTCNTVLPALFQQSGDRFQALARNVPGAPASLVLEVPMGAAQVISGWAMQSSMRWQQTAVGSSPTVAATLILSIPVPPKATIISYSVRVDGHVSSTHSALPEVMPVFSLQRVPSTGTAVEVDTVTDSSASTAVYDAAHTVSKTLSSPHAIVAGNAYYLRIRGENWADSIADALVIYGVSVTFGFDAT